MGAGLTVYNNDNKLQIDGAFRNLQLSRKIALSGTGITSGTFQNGEVLAAVGGTTSQNIDAYCVNTPTGWTCDVKTFTSGMCVYVFSMNTSPSQHGVGLEVYDKDGNCVFNSNDKHPIVVGFGNNESNVVGTATKPALAVSENLLMEWHGHGYQYSSQRVMETKSVYHWPEYGYYTETEYQFQWVTDMWGNQRYEMVPVQVQRYGVIRDGYTELVTEWVQYYYETPYNWNQWEYSNYRLRGGDVVVGSVSTGQSELVFGAMTVVGTEWRATMANYSKLVTGSVKVDTRSWLLLDVNGL